MHDVMIFSITLRLRLLTAF